jgi:hypothetical protein
MRFTAQRGPDLLNRKSHFRQLAAGAGVPQPAGSVVTTEAELAAAVEWLLPETGTVIVKRDNDLGGAGNRALTTKEAHPLNGVRETVAVNGNRAEAAGRLWTELAADGQVLVAEAYYPAVQIFYFEYHIGPDGLARMLDTGLRRDAVGDPGAPSLVWVGLEIPADLPPGTAARGSATEDTSTSTGSSPRTGSCTSTRSTPAGAGARHCTTSARSCSGPPTPTTT